MINKRTTACIMATLATAGTGVGLSFYYASRVASLCHSKLDGVSGYLSDLSNDLLPTNFTIPSFDFSLHQAVRNHTFDIDLDIKIDQVKESFTIPGFSIDIPIVTPSFVLRLVDFIGEGVWDVFETIEDFLEPIPDAASQLCFIEILAHGLALTVTLTGLLGLLSYMCKKNNDLHCEVQSMKSDVEGLRYAMMGIHRKLVDNRVIRPVFIPDERRGSARRKPLMVHI